MKIFIPLTCLLAFVCADAPWSSSQGFHQHEHSSSYSAPLDKTNTGYPKSNTGYPSSGYPNTGYAAPVSQEYGAPSEVYGADLTRPTDSYGAPKAVSETYGAPQTGFGQGYSPSKTYGAPGEKYLPSKGRQSFSSRTLSSSYGAPKSGAFNAPRVSETYGAPNQEYGAPAKVSDKYGVPRVSQQYGTPAGVSQKYNAPGGISQKYGAPRDFSAKYKASRPSDKYGAPNQSYGAPALSDKYSAPQEYSQNYQTPESNQDYSNIAQQYSAPGNSISNSYAPNSRSESFGNTRPQSSYGLPKSFAPSKKYGAPKNPSYDGDSYASKSDYGKAMPSEQYGLPDAASQGYSYGRNGLDENEEPAHYDFSYQVSDSESGSDFGHSETREDARAEGSYFVVLPDGSKQTVEYQADERGFKPKISVEPARGYDDNASDGSFGSNGPY